MTRKDFFNRITDIIKDWKDSAFSFLPKNHVPGLDDNNLTYGNGQAKKGVDINTCVLFVDIRNSVQLTKEKQVKTMGKIYSVFTQCMLLAAQQEGGYVRNIIGDRVMIVFPPDNCYTNAVNCAITINHIAKIIGKQFNGIEFKCGIGIDYGKMSVMKVGIEKKGAENDDNKGLIWVGYPANFASRLTDCANKEFTYIRYYVDAEFYEYHYFNNPLLGGKPNGWHRSKKIFTAEELASSLQPSQYGGFLTTSLCKNVRTIERREVKYKYSPILISETVYLGLAKEKPNRPSIKNKQWRKENRGIPDLEFSVWGADLTWDLS